MSSKHVGQLDYRVKRPYLIVRNVPKIFRKKELDYLCSHHGHVTDIRQVRREDTFFIDLESLQDMHSVFCGLKNSWFRFEVHIGREFRSDMENLIPMAGAHPRSPSSFINTSANNGSDAIDKQENQAGSITTEMPPNGSLVVITSITKTNVIFVRSKMQAKYLRFVSLMAELSAASPEQLREPPICGQIVIAKFKGKFSRAVVLNSTNLEHVKLVFMDFGDVDVRTMRDLYKAPKEYVKIPRLAIPLILKNIPDIPLTQDLRQFTNLYLYDKDMVLRYQTSTDLIAARGVYQAELFDTLTQDSFNVRLAGLISGSTPSSEGNLMLRNKLIQHLVPKGDGMELLIMDNSMVSAGYLSCTMVANATAIIQTQKCIEAYAGTQIKGPAYAPLLEELCIVKYAVDGLWYRGACVSFKRGGHPTIAFLDYGYVAQVPIKDIRRYPPHLTYLPLFTSKCQITGLPYYCPPRLTARLQKLLTNGETIRCKHVEMFAEEQFNRITLPYIIQKLRAEGLLKDEDTDDSGPCSSKSSTRADSSDRLDSDNAENDI